MMQLERDQIEQAGHALEEERRTTNAIMVELRQQADQFQQCLIEQESQMSVERSLREAAETAFGLAIEKREAWTRRGVGCEERQTAQREVAAKERGSLKAMLAASERNVLRRVHRRVVAKPAEVL